MHVLTVQIKWKYTSTNDHLSYTAIPQYLEARLSQNRITDHLRQGLRFPKTLNRERIYFLISMGF